MRQGEDFGRCLPMGPGRREEERRGGCDVVISFLTEGQVLDDDDDRRGTLEMSARTAPRNDDEGEGFDESDTPDDDDCCCTCFCKRGSCSGNEADDTESFVMWCADDSFLIPGAAQTASPAAGIMSCSEPCSSSLSTHTPTVSLPPPLLARAPCVWVTSFTSALRSP